jgi:hypothetical protein
MTEPKIQRFPERIPDATLANKLRDMEGDLCDLREMSNVMTEHIINLVETDDCPLSKQRRRTLTFLAYQLNDMVQDLVSGYYVTMHGEEKPSAA